MTFLADDTPDLAARMRRLTPAGSVVIAGLVMALPLPLAVGVLPNLPLLLVICWASLQPHRMPTWGAFLLGIVYDAIVGLPLGHSALLFAAAVVVVRLAEARVESHSLLLDWLFAGAVIFAAHLLSWQIFLFLGMAAPLSWLLVQAATSIIAFPAVALLATVIQRRLAALDA